jgi:hypothetical protein
MMGTNYIVVPLCIQHMFVDQLIKIEAFISTNDIFSDFFSFRE